MEDLAFAIIAWALLSFCTSLVLAKGQVVARPAAKPSPSLESVAYDVLRLAMGGVEEPGTGKEKTSGGWSGKKDTKEKSTGSRATTATTATSATQPTKGPRHNRQPRAATRDYGGVYSSLRTCNSHTTAMEVVGLRKYESPPSSS